MRYKSYEAPANPQKGDRWISPVQSVPVFDRVWNGTAWEDYVEPEAQKRYPRPPEKTTQDPPQDPPKPTEETKGEQRNETEVSDRDGEQKPDGGSKQPTDGKQGKGGQGKRK